MSFKKYAKVINNEKKVIVGLGTNVEFYKKQGLTLMDIEQSYTGAWYVAGYTPTKPPETTEEQVNRLEREYDMNRWQREAILSEGSHYSAYTKMKAQEIETLAEELRNSKAGE